MLHFRFVLERDAMLLRLQTVDMLHHAAVRVQHVEHDLQHPDGVGGEAPERREVTVGVDTGHFVVGEQNGKLCKLVFHGHSLASACQEFVHSRLLVSFAEVVHVVDGLQHEGVIVHVQILPSRQHHFD